LNYENCGSSDNINTLNQSPLLDMMLEGTLHQPERGAGVTPFTSSDQELNEIFLLVDGMHPRHNKFMKSHKSPITALHQTFSASQEVVQEDIGRNFVP
jgi:hypothetical protein